MKKILIILALILSFSMTLEAVKMKDLKIYINPGHGGYESDDRNISIYPFEMGDTLGYWESKSNLYKGLAMYHILDSIGTKAYLSRTKNGPDDDRDLYSISTEANNNKCDLFFAIHSNAGESVNYPLMLYRENAVGTPRYPGSIELSNILWDNLHSSKLALWTRDNRYVSGDLTFYPQWGNQGLGVLRNLYVPGLLSEGQMHEHRPEAHRLMNRDYCWLEAWHFVKSIMEYFKTDDRFVTGNVAGIIYDDNNTRDTTMEARHTRYGRDFKQPLNGAYVELRDNSGKVIQKLKTDNMNNGVFVFKNVVPGDYKIAISCDRYYDYQKDVKVVANEVTYSDAPMSLKRETPLEILSYSPNVTSDSLVSCVDPIIIKFNYDISQAAFEKGFKIEPAVDGEFSYSDSYHTVQFKPSVAFAINTNYTVTLSTDVATPDPYYSQSHLAENKVFQFTTVGRNRLELIKSFPANNGVIHYQNATMEFRFDKAIKTSTVLANVKVYDKNSNAVSINSRTAAYNKLSNGYGNIILSLVGNLTIGENYKVVLSSGIKDQTDVPLGNDITINFTANNVAEDKTGAVVEDFEKIDALAYNAEESSSLASDPVFYASTSTKLFGSVGLKVNYIFSNMKDGIMVLDYNNGMKSVYKGDKIGLHVYGDLNDHLLSLGFTAGTDTKYFPVCNLDFVGWHYYEITLDELENNVEYLISKVKLQQMPALYAQKGSITFDNMIKYETSGVDNITNDINNDKVVLNDKILTVLSNTEIEKVEVYNIDGTCALTSNVKVVDCKALSAGVYLVKLTTNKATTTTKVVLK